MLAGACEIKESIVEGFSELVRRPEPSGRAGSP
jgi:hypothetical protein